MAVKTKYDGFELGLIPWAVRFSRSGASFASSMPLIVCSHRAASEASEIFANPGELKRKIGKVAMLALKCGILISAWNAALATLRGEPVQLDKLSEGLAEFLLVTMLGVFLGAVHGNIQ